MHSLFEELILKPSPLQVYDYLKIALRLNDKLNSNRADWYNYTGKMFEEFAEFRKQDDKIGMMPLRFYSESMSCFKSAGNKISFGRVSKKFQDQKSKLNLGRFRYPVKKSNLIQIEKFNQNKIEILKIKSSIFILDYLVFGIDILPHKSIYEIRNKNEWFESMVFSKIEFDINKNIIKRNTNEKNILNESKFKKYHLYMQLFTIPFLIELFIQTTLKNKIGFVQIIQFLQENSWLGRFLSATNSEGEMRNYYWTELIKPSIAQFFSTFEVDIKTEGTLIHSYMLCIESLSLKFEGILRDFSKRAGLSTVIINSNGVIKEKTTEALLRDGQDKLLEFFPKSDLMLFWYVFTKEGINLRNDIAHCYYRYPMNFSLEKMVLLIISILKIGSRRINYIEDE